MGLGVLCETSTSLRLKYKRSLWDNLNETITQAIRCHLVGRTCQLETFPYALAALKHAELRVINWDMTSLCNLQ